MVFMQRLDEHRLLILFLEPHPTFGVGKLYTEIKRMHVTHLDP